MCLPAKEKRVVKPNKPRMARQFEHFEEKVSLGLLGTSNIIRFFDIFRLAGKYIYLGVLNQTKAKSRLSHVKTN